MHCSVQQNGYPVLFVHVVGRHDAGFFYYHITEKHIVYLEVYYGHGTAAG